MAIVRTTSAITVSVLGFAGLVVFVSRCVRAIDADVTVHS